MASNSPCRYATAQCIHSHHASFGTCYQISGIGEQRAVCCVQATANPVIKGVVVRGANVLPQKEIEEAFQHQFGRTLNFPQFSGALKKLNKWYEDRGIFGQARTSACGCLLI